MTVKNFNWVKNIYDIALSKVVLIEYVDTDGEVKYIAGTLNKNTVYLYNERYSKNINLSSDVLVLFDLLNFCWKKIPLEGINKDSIVISSLTNDYIYWKEIYLTSCFKRRVDVLNLLSDNVLELVLENEEGKPYLLTCSKQMDLKYEVYQSPNMNSYLNRSKCNPKYPIKVYDYKTDNVKEFCFDRLIKYRIKGSKSFIPFYRNEDIGEDILKCKIYNIKNRNLFDKALIEGKIENSKNINLYEIEDTLNNKIVRMVFLNTDDSIFIVYGTRNKEMLKKYVSKIPINKFSIGEKKLTVFDVKRKRFINLDFNNLCEYDFINKVGSWIEFDIEDSGWFKIIYHGISIVSFYNLGSRKALPLGIDINGYVLDNYTSYEFLESYDKYEDLVNLRNKVFYDNLLNDVCNGIVYLKFIDDKSKEKSIMATLLIDIIKNHNENLSILETENKDNVIKVFDLYSLNWCNINIETILKDSLKHYNISLDGLSFEGYDDKVFKKENKVIDILQSNNNHVELIIKERRKVDTVNKEQNKSDYKRMVKLKEFLSNKDDILLNLGLEYKYSIDKIGNVIVLIMSNSSNGINSKIIVSPAYIIDLNKSNKVIYERTQWYRTIKDFKELVYENSEILGFSKEQNFFLVETFSYCWDLRKK